LLRRRVGERPPLRVEACVPSYLVELYLPRSSADEARAAGTRARAAAAELSAEGVPIRYVRTTFLPADAADSAEAVDEVCRRAALGRVRIAFAVETPPQKASSRRAASTTRSGEGM
jgi:hypothetical protein